MNVFEIFTEREIALIMLYPVRGSIFLLLMLYHYFSIAKLKFILIGAKIWFIIFAAANILLSENGDVKVFP